MEDNARERVRNMSVLTIDTGTVVLALSNESEYGQLFSMP